MADIDWEERAISRKSELTENACVPDLEHLAERISSNWISVSDRLPPFSKCEAETDLGHTKPDRLRETSSLVLVRLDGSEQIAELGRYRIATYYRVSLSLASEDVFHDPDELTFEDDHAWYEGWEDGAEELHDFSLNLTPDAWFPLPSYVDEPADIPASSGRDTAYDPQETTLLVRRLIEENRLLRIPRGRARASKTRVAESDGFRLSVSLSSSALPSSDDIEWLRELAARFKKMVPEGVLLEQELTRGGTRETLRARVERCCVQVVLRFERPIDYQSRLEIFEAWRIKSPENTTEMRTWSTADYGWPHSMPWDGNPHLAGIWFNRALLDQFLDHQTIKA